MIHLRVLELLRDNELLYINQSVYGSQCENVDLVLKKIEAVPSSSSESSIPLEALIDDNLIWS